MKLSEYISRLQAIQEAYGDLPIVHHVEAAGMSGQFETYAPEVEKFNGHYCYHGELAKGTDVVVLAPEY